jgi:orotidine-5'-phosphate decarboxylase
VSDGRRRAQPFGDRLATAVAARESQVVLGLDPDPARLWPGGEGAAEPGRAVADHCRRVIDAAGPACVAVKPQLACFERLGAPGWAALEAAVAHAREQGLLVLLDGKRGDVPVTAAVYAQALTQTLPGDAFTANPLLGRDAVEPLVTAAREHGAGCFLLVRTSNPGATDLLDLELAASRRWSTRSARPARRGSRTSARSPARRRRSTWSGCAS